MCINHMHARCLQKPEENIESSWTWDTDDCGLPCHCWKLNPSWKSCQCSYWVISIKKKIFSDLLLLLGLHGSIALIDMFNLRLFQRPICSLSKVTIQYVATVYVLIFVLGHPSSKKPWIPVSHLVLKFIFIYLFIHLFNWWGERHTIVYMWRSEDKLTELVLPPCGFWESNLGHHSKCLLSLCLHILLLPHSWWPIHSCCFIFL